MDDELFPGAKKATRYVEGWTGAELVEVERGPDSGSVWIASGDNVLPPLDKGDVRWLVGVLTAALDNWPQQG